ncbi:MAG TPA: hypothetical protein VFQ61_16035 [Polyangiaceae bacterium]|nr:hypothetical protein [Polyangiaceae bacterium]
MSCCTSSQRRSPGMGYRDPITNKDRVEVMGTWDFKWPLGSKIRVAFQQPSSREINEADFLESVQIIKQLAELWIKAAPHQAAPNIEFDWSPPPFSRADPTDPQNGSTFAFPSGKQEYRARDYDVLISLDTLPRGKRDPATLERVQRNFLPSSELGSFARRVDYGVPTAYLGPFAGQASADGEFRLAHYYKTNSIARFYVIHEFGHILGLAHTHQSRSRRATLPPEAVARLTNIVIHSQNLIRVESSAARWGDTGLEASTSIYSGQRRELRKEIAPIKATLRAFLDRRHIPITLEEAELDDFVVSQIVESWPGNDAFSDWPAAGPSIMDIPYFECLIGLHRAADGFCEICEELISRGAPLEGDLRALAAMYPCVE